MLWYYGKEIIKDFTFLYTVRLWLICLVRRTESFRRVNGHDFSRMVVYGKTKEVVWLDDSAGCDADDLSSSRSIALAALDYVALLILGSDPVQIKIF